MIFLVVSCVHVILFELDVLSLDRLSAELGSFSGLASALAFWFQSGRSSLATFAHVRNVEKVLYCIWWHSFLQAHYRVLAAQFPACRAMLSQCFLRFCKYLQSSRCTSWFVFLLWLQSVEELVSRHCEILLPEILSMLLAPQAACCRIRLSSVWILAVEIPFMSMALRVVYSFWIWYVLSVSSVSANHFTITPNRCISLFIVAVNNAWAGFHRVFLCALDCVHVNLFESDFLSERVQWNHFLLAAKCARHPFALQQILAPWRNSCYVHHVSASCVHWIRSISFSLTQKYNFCTTDTIISDRKLSQKLGHAFSQRRARIKGFPEMDCRALNMLDLASCCHLQQPILSTLYQLGRRDEAITFPVADEYK